MRILRPIAALTLAAAPLTAGNLNPPVGPPSSTMKTLDEVEARIPINQDTAPGQTSYTHVISEPGSYYLTGNVTVSGGGGIVNGIFISAERVTLDLNGYSIVGFSTGNGNGIAFPTGIYPDSITIRNGTIQIWENGVLGSADSAVFEDLKLIDTTTGVNMAAASYGVSIERCAFLYMGTGAFVGETARVAGCTFRSVGQAVQVTNGAIITDCIVAGSGAGFVGSNVLVRGCRVVNAATPYNLTGSSAVIDSIPASP